MNWRRGTFRLWIAFSVFWFAISIFVAYEEAINVSAPIYLYADDTALQFPANTSKPKVRSAILGYLREKNFAPQHGADVGGGKLVTDGAVLDQLNGSKADEIMKNYEPRSYLAVLAVFLAVFLIPTVGLLVLGFVTGWVVRGFRKAAA